MNISLKTNFSGNYKYYSRFSNYLLTVFIMVGLE